MCAEVFFLGTDVTALRLEQLPLHHFPTNDPTDFWNTTLARSLRHRPNICSCRRSDELIHFDQNDVNLRRARVHGTYCTAAVRRRRMRCRRLLPYSDFWFWAEWAGGRRWRCRPKFTLSINWKYFRSGRAGCSKTTRCLGCWVRVRQTNMICALSFTVTLQTYSKTNI